MEQNIVRGLTIYNGHFAAQQVDEIFEVFGNFLEEIKPARVLEIGTAQGGFIYFIREKLNQIGLMDSPILSFDIHEQPWYNIFRQAGIDVKIEDIFDGYTKLTNPDISSFIQEQGRTLVLCDGGNKIKEFNILAPFLKTGDIIMAHDYCDTVENFQNNYYNKIWNWCEITEQDINQTCEEHNLKSYNKEIMDKLVWACKIKN